MSHGSRGLSRLAAAVAVALVLAGCGGGGGGTRTDPPPQGPPPTPPLPPPPPPPGPPVVLPPEPAYSHHLSWTNAGPAHEAGLDGSGIRIGVIDSGVNRDHPALAGRVVANLTYIDPRRNDLSVDDVVGHGTAVAQVIAGRPFGRWPGGLAPGAEIVSARIISDSPPDDDGSGRGNEINGPLGIGPIHDDLIARGARILNNSWGGLYWTNLAVTAQIAAEYRPFIVDHGGLVVFSTGNSGFDDPSDTAALPSQAGSGGSRPAADLERGWLAVAALSDESPEQLAYYSNACGVAMDYCLVAPGTVVVTGTDDPPDAPEYWRWSGTSFAAPIVSGAAALVWEAFPYFDNDLVRQTLLGTATDLGAPGVDAVFGHGRLDVGAAALGPARLDWGDVRVRFDEITSTWGNALSGDGAVVKDGSGTLVLEREAGNAGGIQVLGGTVDARAGIAGDVRIGSAGRLVMSRGADGDIDNAGRLEVPSGGSGPGAEETVTAGDFRQRAGATLAVELGQVLRVGGHALLEGGTLHVMGLAPHFTTTDREWILGAGDGITGRFDALSWADTLFLEGTLDYGENDIWLDITRLDVAATVRKFASASPATLSSAERVERAFRRLDALVAQASDADPELLRVAGAFQRIGDEAAAKAALDSLSGAGHARATSLALDTLDMGRRALASRFGNGEQAAGPVAWKQALGRGGATGFAGGDHALDGWLMGREDRSGDLVAGFAFGEAVALERFGVAGERSRERMAMAQLYAGRRSGDAYALVQAGAGRFDRGIERSLFAGEAARDGIFSRYGGNYASLGIEWGRRFALGGLELTPYLGASHDTLRTEAFEETGGAGFALQVEAGELERSQAIAGLRLERGWRGTTLRAWGEWQQTLRADGFDVLATFTGIDSWAPLPMADAAKSGGLLGVGAEAPLGRHGWLSFGFDQRFGPRGDERMARIEYVLAF
jgi:autotransporter-associated beta strand protein